MSDSISTLKLFVRVARTGSISEAGREFGLPQPTASRAIANLEREVGAALLTRSTRAVVLTDAGASYLASIEPLLEALDEANHSARGTGELRGMLRVALSSSLANRAVIPRLPAFLERHPALRVSLLIDDKRQDLLREGVDVALRMGELPDSSAVARLLGRNERLLAAAPGYLRRAGTPNTPAELAGHQIIIGPTGVSAGGWSFERDGVRQTPRVEGRVSASANESAIAAALAGLGILSTGLLGCQAELASGALLRVLPDWRQGSSEINAVLPSGRAAKASARAFVDYMVAAFKDMMAA